MTVLYILPLDPPPKAAVPQSPSLPSVAPGTVNPHKAFCSVVRTRMNTHSVVMVGEVDCCDHVSLAIFISTLVLLEFCCLFWHIIILEECNALVIILYMCGHGSGGRALTA